MKEKIYEIYFRRTVKLGMGSNESTSIFAPNATEAMKIIRDEQAPLEKKYGYKTSKYSARLLSEREREEQEREAK